MTPATAFPAWLRARLVETGVLTPAGLSRRAKPMLHRPCRGLVLAGFDSDSCAFDAFAETSPLTPGGEVEALLDDRATFDLEGGRLYRRDRWSITGRPPSVLRTILAEHRCHHPLPEHWLAPVPDSVPTPRMEF